MTTNGHPDGWADFADLLGLILNLFGDALKATEPLAPKIAESASRWLRAAEAFARVLLLMLARGVTLEPRAPRTQRTRRATRGAAGGHSLFAMPCARGTRTRRARREMTHKEMQDWYFFGGKERAAEARAARKALGVVICAPPGAPASSRPSVAGRMPAVPAKSALPTRANLVRRYNALVRVFTAPDRAARRLARQLAATPALAQRALAAAAGPKARWRSGYDDTIRRYAQQAAAARHDTS